MLTTEFDLEAALEAARLDGIEKVAKDMLKDNMEINIVVKYTNLPVSKVKEIQKELEK